MIKYNMIKSEQPLLRHGVLFSAVEAAQELDPSSQVEFYLHPFGQREGDDKPIRKSWPHLLTIDQGRTSMASACAWTQFLTTGNVIPDLEMESIDFATQLYKKSQERDPYSGNDELGHYGTTSIAPALVLKDENYGRKIVWGNTVSELEEYLYHGPMVVAAPWYADMSRIDPNGFARPNGIYEGNHAFLVYGVDSLWETFFCLNSWGKDYGRDGKFLVKFSDMKRLLDQGHALALR